MKYSFFFDNKTMQYRINVFLGAFLTKYLINKNQNDHKDRYKKNQIDKQQILLRRSQNIEK